MVGPLAVNTFQRSDHLAWSSLRFAQGQALSETKDLCAASQILRFTQDDTPETASFDWQQVFFEMYCPLRSPFIASW
jgi:hypothetical protein